MATTTATTTPATKPWPSRTQVTALDGIPQGSGYVREPLPLCRICMSACDEGDAMCGGYFCWSKDEPEVRK